MERRAGSEITKETAKKEAEDNKLKRSIYLINMKIEE